MIPTNENHDQAWDQTQSINTNEPDFITSTQVNHNTIDKDAHKSQNHEDKNNFKDGNFLFIMSRIFGKYLVRNIKHKSTKIPIVKEKLQIVQKSKTMI